MSWCPRSAIYQARFPSPRGDKLCPAASVPGQYDVVFPSPRGDKLCRHQPRRTGLPNRFPSPRGDKLCRFGCGNAEGCVGFRPLAGISCVQLVEEVLRRTPGFRPLAGISCVDSRHVAVTRQCMFPSPRGDKLCLHHVPTTTAITSFRPLAGISCVKVKVYLFSQTFEFPSPRGDKLCPQNCPTGACGIQAGF